MNGECDAGMVTDHSIVEFDTPIKQAVRIVAALSISLADGRVQQGCVLRRVNLNVSTTKLDQLFDFASKDVDDVSEIGVNRWIGLPGLFRIVVGCRLLSAEQSNLATGARASPQIGELFGAHVALAAQFRQ